MQAQRADQVNGTPTGSAPADGTTHAPNTAGQANALPQTESTNTNSSAMSTDPAAQRATAHPWEFVDEISNVLKTASPLLTPSLELLAENMATRFKPTPEEEVYRFIIALLTEGLHVSQPVHVACLES